VKLNFVSDISVRGRVVVPLHFNDVADAKVRLHANQTVYGDLRAGGLKSSAVKVHAAEPGN
jgi:hypothetical protein